MQSKNDQMPCWQCICTVFSVFHAVFDNFVMFVSHLQFSLWITHENMIVHDNDVKLFTHNVSLMLTIINSWHSHCVVCCSVFCKTSITFMQCSVNVWCELPVFVNLTVNSMLFLCICVVCIVINNTWSALPVFTTCLHHSKIVLCWKNCFCNDDNMHVCLTKAFVNHSMIHNANNALQHLHFNCWIKLILHCLQQMFHDMNNRFMLFASCFSLQTAHSHCLCCIQWHELNRCTVHIAFHCVISMFVVSMLNHVTWARHSCQFHCIWCSCCIWSCWQNICTVCGVFCSAFGVFVVLLLCFTMWETCLCQMHCLSCSKQCFFNIHTVLQIVNVAIMPIVSFQMTQTFHVCCSQSIMSYEKFVCAIQILFHATASMFKLFKIDFAQKIPCFQCFWCVSLCVAFNTIHVCMLHVMWNWLNVTFTQFTMQKMIFAFFMPQTACCFVFAMSLMNLSCSITETLCF